MVRSRTPSSTDSPLSTSNPNLHSLNNAAQSLSVIPPNLHEAFSLAGVYGENMALSSYANLAAWQTPWYNNFFNSPAIRNFNPTNAVPALHGPQAPRESVGNENQSPLNSNSNQSGTPNLPLPQQLLNSYNNYLAPNFGSLLAPNNSITNPITTTIPNSNGISASSPPPSAQVTNVLRSLNVPINNGRSQNNNTPVHSSGPMRVRHAVRTQRSSVTSRNCECPNCMELVRQGLPLDRRNEKHNCHVPGCMKVYGKSSHLKAHLRWHNVYQQNRRNGELSHTSVLNQSTDVH